MDCLFCKIASGEIPSTKVYEDEKVLAFRDISPQAPVHIVLIPKTHYADILEIPHDSTEINDMIRAVQIIAKQEGMEDEGFRVVTNCREFGRPSALSYSWKEETYVATRLKKACKKIKISV